MIGGSPILRPSIGGAGFVWADKEGDVVVEAFFGEENSACAAVAVGEDVDKFEQDVEVQESVQVGGGAVRYSPGPVLLFRSENVP